MNDLNGVKQSIRKWLDLAAELDKMTEKAGLFILKTIPENKVNCRELIGWLQRAFVLSFYFLKRFKAY